MADKDQDYRIFIGGLSRDVTERKLESTFGRFGKIVDCQNFGTNSSAHIMLERDTGRPRGFGFLTFSDSRAMEDAIKDMHGRELGERVISVNRAQPKGAEDAPHGHGSHAKGGRESSYGGRDKPVPGQGDCFKCGRPGHWARDCTSSGGARGGRGFSPRRSKYGGAPFRYADDRDRYVDDRYDRDRYGDRDRYENRYDRYDHDRDRDRYISDRYAPIGDRIAAERYGAPPDRYPHNGYGKERGSGDRYGGGAGLARYDGRSYRERPTPYEPPRRGGRPISSDRY